MVLIHSILSHIILNNCNKRSRNQQVYQLYMFTFIKISLKTAPVERAETCSRKGVIVYKLTTWKLC